MRGGMRGAGSCRVPGRLMLRASRAARRGCPHWWWLFAIAVLSYRHLARPRAPGIDKLLFASAGAMKLSDSITQRCRSTSGREREREGVQRGGSGHLNGSETSPLPRPRLRPDSSFESLGPCGSCAWLRSLPFPRQWLVISPVEALRRWVGGPRGLGRIGGCTEEIWLTFVAGLVSTTPGCNTSRITPLTLTLALLGDSAPSQ